MKEKLASTVPPLKLLKVVQVCEMLNLSRSSIYALMDSGRLEYHRMGKGNCRRIALAAVEKYLAECVVPAR